MISLVAQVRTSTGIGSAALRDVSAHLRSFTHVLSAPGQYLVTLPSGTALNALTALIDESRTILRVDLVVENEDAAARACAALAREVEVAVGNFGVIISWSRREVPVFERRV